MDSTGFNVAVKNFTNLNSEETDAVKSLSQQYPYSQIIHLLMARAAKDQSDHNSEYLLHQSAIYATDRSVLKWVMTAPRIERIQEIHPTIIEVPVVSKPAEVSSEVVSRPIAERESSVTDMAATAPAIVSSTSSSSSSSLSGDALRNDIYVELEKLKKLKHDFELSFDEFQHATKDGAHKKPNAQNTSSKEPLSDPLLEEIKTSKKKLKIDSPKQKEQNEIIDQFIKTSPVIPKPKSSSTSDDLSEDSSIFSDNIVSETLVDILLKQGKKEKAIEVLKKLIWKFPQKKAYFAAQIEELKN